MEFFNLNISHCKYNISKIYKMTKSTRKVMAEVEKNIKQMEDVSDLNKRWELTIEYRLWI